MYIYNNNDVSSTCTCVHIPNNEYMYIYNNNDVSTCVHIPNNEYMYIYDVSSKCVQLYMYNNNDIGSTCTCVHIRHEVKYFKKYLSIISVKS